MSNNWHKIWNEKDTQGISINTQSKEEILDSLLEAAGYNGGTNSSVTHKEHLQFVSEFVYPRVSDCESFFEVGCGCGAFLHALKMVFEKNGKAIKMLGGVDYSINFIEVIKNLLPNTEVFHGEANKIDVSKKYDCILSFSVFHYFLNLEYAKEVLSKMVEKANKKIVVMDLQDLAKKEEAINFRKKIYGEDYQAKYGKGYEHLYYSKDFFMDFANEMNLKCEIKDQNIKNYLNSQFRFNVVLEK